MKNTNRNDINISLLLWLIAGALCLQGCRTITFQQAYPSLYAARGHNEAFPDLIAFINFLHVPATVGRQRTPRELLEAAPPEVQIASEVGRLVTLLDANGKFVGGVWPNAFAGPVRNPIAIQSSDFLKTRQAFINARLKEYTLPGYPNVSLFVSPSDPATGDADPFDSEYGQVWLYFLTPWETRLAALKSQDLDIDALIKNIADNQATLALVSADYDRVVLERQAVEADITRLNQEIGAMQTARARTIVLTARTAPSFTPTTTYDPADDFFIRRVFKEYFADVSNEPWIDHNQNPAAPYLAFDTAQAVALANQIITDPDRYAPDLATEVKAAQLTPVTVISCARSPIQQAYEGISNPSAAPTLNSNHAMGLAVDINMNGTNYDVRGSNPSPAAWDHYRTLQKVMDRAGMVNTVVESNAKERKHFEVAQFAPRRSGGPNAKYNAMLHNKFRASVMNLFRAAADDEIRAQLQAKDLKDKEKNKRVLQAAAQAQAIADRQAQLEQERQKLEQAQQKRADLQRELQRRQELERRRREQTSPREPHGPREPHNSDPGNMPTGPVDTVPVHPMPETHEAPGESSPGPTIRDVDNPNIGHDTDSGGDHEGGDHDSGDQGGGGITLG